VSFGQALLDVLNERFVDSSVPHIAKAHVI
jgi:hypothetical protein